ncbi:MAG: non-canonical purine NTP pyrophosphatase, RdgB/HAM1 family [Gammaproteobacteria bacterium]|nr:non-canonical purine NTP pyrophosphatase, RdgB/HAM1 family [Gammaproteobacteria bacterium]HBW82990.1 non-canonical purine NTP pyrophosphatase, RdgB/HAM1 family [Gammaproteobacteria bacterium]|tara:strand:+ start:679 stop:1287 length:609 start_codon:yes stop_codon:yes gene_type:complete
MLTKRVVLASSNKGKLKELQQVLQQKNIELLPQSKFGVSDAEETGLSFVENAIIKARHACEMTGLPSVADDSGIEVDALDGKPGIYSARYSGITGEGADEANNRKLLKALEDFNESERTARFRCLIVYLKNANDPVPLICQGTWEGRILTNACGTNGFGYDPLFYVPTHQCSSAELPREVKDAISHRGQALQKLIKCWVNLP